MPLSAPPTFSPPAVAIPVPVGAGLVLTSQGGAAAPAFAAPVVGTLLGLFTGGAVLSYASPAGVSNNVNPGGAWPGTTIGRLEVDTTAGAATWSGLVASAQDGHGVVIIPIGVNTLTLQNLNAGSAAANQFRYIGDLVLTQYDPVILVYYGGAVNKWVAI